MFAIMSLHEKHDKFIAFDTKCHQNRLQMIAINDNGEIISAKS